VQTPTKAQKLHTKEFKGFPEGEDIVIVNSDKVYYTFDDGSIAYLLTRLEECEPYLTPSLSTMRVKRVAYWQAV
jgi:hypothetical protein